MTIRKAVAIADGMDEADDKEFAQAFQVLVDTGIAWTMPKDIIDTLWQLVDIGDVTLTSNYSPKHERKYGRFRR